MFHFSGYASRRNVGIALVYNAGFSHSEILGSQVAKHLPEAYRSHATSFIAFSSQGIHHTPLIIFLLSEYYRNPILTFQSSGASAFQLFQKWKIRHSAD